MPGNGQLPNYSSFGSEIDTFLIPDQPRHDVSQGLSLSVTSRALSLTLQFSFSSDLTTVDDSSQSLRSQLVVPSKRHLMNLPTLSFMFQDSLSMLSTNSKFTPFQFPMKNTH